MWFIKYRGHELLGHMDNRPVDAWTEKAMSPAHNAVVTCNLEIISVFYFTCNHCRW